MIPARLLPMLLNGGTRLSFSVIVPDQPGIEWDTDESRLHYHTEASRLHFDTDDSRLHWGVDH